MISVNFKGYGEWFVRDGNSIKLAIVRRTNNPFEDPQEWKPPKPYGPYSDEYPYPDDDNEENCLNQQLSFPDRDGEFDRDLRGIFWRDNNVRGKIYDTNSLRCKGADYMICGKYPEFGGYEVRGVFSLTGEDEEDFLLANFDPKTDWEKFKDRIKILKPCSHPNSLFTKMVNEGKLSVDLEDKVYFEIQKKLYFDLYGAPAQEVDYKLDYVGIESKNLSAKIKHEKGDVLLNEPSRKDDWFEAINDMTIEFFKRNEKLPNETQAWNQLFANPPHGYLITAGENKSKEKILQMPGVKDLERRNFSERWSNYSPLKKN